jgi:hypothetical protein
MGGTKFLIQNDSDPLEIALELAGCIPFQTPITYHKSSQITQAILLDTRGYSIESVIIF